MICEKCKREVHVGDWPHCPHESTRPEYAQRFSPIVYFRSPDGKTRFPMRADAKTPKGYERVELTNRRQVERFEKEMNQRERAEYQDSQHKQSQFYGSKIDQTDAYLRSIEHQLSPQARQSLDMLREQAKRKDDAPKPQWDAGFHIEAMHYNSSNRDPHNDSDTNWRDRKG